MSFFNNLPCTKSRLLGILLGGLAGGAPRAGNAQLRPLDPIEFAAFADNPIRFELGAGVYGDQRASLAGTEGQLWELGNFHLTIRTGRTVLEFGGTVQRLFSEDTVWAAPYGDAVAPPANHHRHDAGDYRAAVIVRLTSDRSPTLATLRFGTRLPTTDNRVGLDRDATDFFATLAARRALGKVAVSGEAGVSINGTRKTTYEQSDVLTYGITATLPGGRFTPYVIALGQEDFHNWAVRGNEDLGELRTGVRIGGARWLNLAWVRGYREFSPGNGLQLSAGATF